MTQQATENRIGEFARNSLLLWAALLGPSLALAHGDVHQLIDVLSVEIDRRPSPQLLLKRAALHEDDGDFQSALADYQRVLSQYPRQPDALFFGAKAALRLGRVAEATALANRFSETLPPTPPRATKARSLMLLAEVRLAQDSPAQALPLLKEGLSLQEHPSPERWLQLAELEAEIEGYPTARDTLLSALEAQGSIATLEDKLLSLAKAAGDHETVIALLDRQLQHAAALRKVSLLLEKAETLAQLARLDAARHTADEARTALAQLPYKHQKLALNQDIPQRLQALQTHNSPAPGKTP